MKNILYISASPRIESSHSRMAARAVVARLAVRHPGLGIVDRDLSRDPPPHIDGLWAEANVLAAAARAPIHERALRLSELLIAELEAAELVLVSTPMHNFAVPSSLKAWVDHVVRPRRTFAMTPHGKVGLLQDRPVGLIMACGGQLGSEPAGQPDFLAPYLRHVFRTMGLSRMSAMVLENRRSAPNEPPDDARIDAWLDALVEEVKA